MGTIEFTLGERHHFDELDATGERLGAAGHRPERRRAGQQPTTIVVLLIQFSLDCLQQLGDMLVLVDAHRYGPSHRVRWRCVNSGAYDRIVEVCDLDIVLSGEFGERCGLADRAGTLEHDHGRFGHSVGDDRQDPTVDQR